MSMKSPVATVVFWAAMTPRCASTRALASGSMIPGEARKTRSSAGVGGRWATWRGLTAARADASAALTWRRLRLCASAFSQAACVRSSPGRVSQKAVNSDRPSAMASGSSTGKPMSLAWTAKASDGRQPSPIGNTSPAAGPSRAVVAGVLPEGEDEEEEPRGPKPPPMGSPKGGFGAGFGAPPLPEDSARMVRTYSSLTMRLEYQIGPPWVSIKVTGSPSLRPLRGV